MPTVVKTHLNLGGSSPSARHWFLLLSSIHWDSAGGTRMRPIAGEQGRGYRASQLSCGTYPRCPSSPVRNVEQGVSWTSGRISPVTRNLSGSNSALVRVGPRRSKAFRAAEGVGVTPRVSESGVRVQERFVFARGLAFRSWVRRGIDAGRRHMRPAQPAPGRHRVRVRRQALGRDGLPQCVGKPNPKPATTG